MQGPKQSKTYLSPALFVKGLFSLRSRGLSLTRLLRSLLWRQATLRARVTPANGSCLAGLLHTPLVSSTGGLLNTPCSLTLPVQVSGTAWVDAGKIAPFLGLSVTAVTILDLLGKSPLWVKMPYIDSGSSSPDHRLFWLEPSDPDDRGFNVPDWAWCRWVI